MVLWPEAYIYIWKFHIYETGHFKVSQLNGNTIEHMSIFLVHTIRYSRPHCICFTLGLTMGILQAYLNLHLYMLDKKEARIYLQHYEYVSFTLLYWLCTGHMTQRVALLKLQAFVNWLMNLTGIKICVFHCEIAMVLTLSLYMM